MVVNKENLYEQVDAVQNKLHLIQAHNDVLTSEEHLQLLHDVKHINAKLEEYENKANDKLVYMLRYFKHKFSVILKALTSRYTDKPVYFSKVQLMNPDQYIRLAA
jgi:hypothetical protein